MLVWKWLHRAVPSRMAVALAIVLMPVMLASCASVPRRGPVTDAVPSAFSASGEMSVKPRWWLSLQDTTLNRLMDQALGDNLSLKGAFARLAQAEAMARRERASRFPSLDAQAGATRVNRSDAGPGIQEGNTLTVSGAASYELDIWGRVRSLSDAAALDYQGRAEDLDAAALTLSAQVALTYYQLVEQQAQLTLLADQLASNEQVLELVTLRFRRGRVSATDVLRQRQSAESFRGQISLASGRRAALEHALAVLLGRGPREKVLSADAYMFAPLPPLPETGVPADLIRQRPDTRRAFLSLQAADRRAAAAVAARFPRISLSGQVSTSGESSGDLFHNWVTNLGANLLLPLFDAGRRKAEVDRSQALTTELLHTYEQIVLNALREVEDALVQEQRQHQYLTSLESQLSMSQKVIDRTRDNFTSGAATYLQVLDALRTHQQLERSVLTGRRGLLSNRIELYRALGGGFGVMADEKDDVVEAMEEVE